MCSGPPQARWLESDVNDHLEALAAGRLTDGTAVAAPDGVVVAPIGFVADHMEVVFDLDTEARATAERLAMPYVRAATAGTHPAFIASLADILLEQARGGGGLCRSSRFVQRRIAHAFCTFCQSWA